MLMDNYDMLIGFENLYKITRGGSIYSCIYRKPMTQLVKDDGYLYVNLSKDGKRSKGYIHRLVAKQYIPNPDNLPEVDHIDRNKTNNNIENLRWVDRTTNARNKSNYKDNLTEEQLEARKERTRERARVWAEKKRRELGVTKIEDKTKTKDPNYKRDWSRNKRANMTEEEKGAQLQRRREYRLNNPLSEEQKERARERSRLWRLKNASIYI
jgi:hypothetical protein